MTVRATRHDHRDDLATGPIAFGDLGLSVCAEGPVVADRPNRVVAEHRRSAVSQAPMRDLVGRVVSVGAQLQMRDLDTPRVVAEVSYDHLRWDRAVREFPGHPVRNYQTSMHPEMAMAETVGAALPEQAAVGRTSAVLGEPFGDWEFGELATVPPLNHKGDNTP
jgi:hypothetical protein